MPFDVLTSVTGLPDAHCNGFCCGTHPWCVLVNIARELDGHPERVAGNMDILAELTTERRHDNRNLTKQQEENVKSQ
jgi:hypothetical protein